jgi:DNA polymerase-1
MPRLVLIDGNSILNRAFYGIMGSKMLTTPDGKYTNAVYGFLAIMFKVIDDLNPEYMAVAFDLKAPTARHKMYEGYKATRKGMPNELAEQMPIIKEILELMHITIIEKEGYEADDILGTLAKKGEKAGLDVTIVSGDRDTFQLATSKIVIRIPHTKVGKTEVDTFGEEDIIQKYGVKPKELIEVKGLMGDTSDNIPGIPGVGEKNALDIVKQYKTIDKLYKAVEEGTDTLKGKLRERVVENKDLALLSRTLGTINTEVPLEESIEDLKIREWDNEKVFEKFKELNFNRFIDRFNLQTEQKEKEISDLVKIEEKNVQDLKEILEKANKEKELVYLLEKEDNNDSQRIIKKSIKAISIYDSTNNMSYYVKLNEAEFVQTFKNIFENEEIKKYGYNISEDYCLLKELGIEINNIYYDVKIAAYDLNPTNSNFSIENVANQYLGIDTSEYLSKYEEKNKKEEQLNLFQTEEADDNSKYIYGFKVYLIKEISKKTLEELAKINSMELFEKIEMPLVKILGEMQINGMYVDKEELVSFGTELKAQIENLKTEIYNLCGEEFNINSTQQLGVVLFEKLKLPVYKKTKSGYSTDVDILEKLKPEHPVIEKILEYRSLMKLNSTYVEGLLPYINEKTHRIHSYFHQTITATGRISSTEPNLQNIPTRYELGKLLRKAFKPSEGNIFIDADYSQIELRVLAHISGDRNMVMAFKHDEDIHKQAASKVFEVPIDEVTKEQRSSAKAVNFGIVYGISDFGLSEQLGISKKQAKRYIEQYLERYSGIKKFMDNIVEETKEKGYVETLFHRRRYIPELSSNNYMVRQFGARAAMNTPIQGTAADIMKIAMINVFNKIKEEKLENEAKIVLQVHDELIIECKKEKQEKVEEILKQEMENAMKLKVPLKVEISEANNWYEAK